LKQPINIPALMCRYQCCVVFACFLSCVLGVFNSLVVTPAHGPLGLSRRFIPKNASLLGLYICATTQGPDQLH